MPCTVKGTTSKKEAKGFKRQLVEAGARVELKG